MKRKKGQDAYANKWRGMERIKLNGNNGNERRNEKGPEKKRKQIKMSNTEYK